MLRAAIYHVIVVMNTYFCLGVNEYIDLVLIIKSVLSYVILFYFIYRYTHLTA